MNAAGRVAAEFGEMGNRSTSAAACRQATNQGDSPSSSVLNTNTHKGLAVQLGEEKEIRTKPRTGAIVRRKSAWRINHKRESKSPNGQTSSHNTQCSSTLGPSVPHLLIRSLVHIGLLQVSHAHYVSLSSQL